MSQLRGGVLTPIKQRARNALHRGVDRNQRLVLPNHQFDQFPLDPDTTLAFKFARDKSLTDAVAGLTLGFTRPSEATFYDSAGILRTAAIDVARFDHDPFTHESLGLFRERSATNLAVESNNFAAAAWAKQRCTVAQDETGPDGVANSAWTLTDDAVLGTHAVSQPGIFPTQANRRPSVFLKAGTARYLTLATRNYGSTPSSRVSIFDTQTGTFAHQGAAYQDFLIERLENGFFRISKTGFDLNATYDDIWCGISNGPNPLDTSYVGTGETGIFYGAQGELDFTSSYIDSGASTETRGTEAGFTTDMSWFDDAQGTWFGRAKLQPFSDGFFGAIAEANDGSSSDRHSLRTSASSAQANYFVRRLSTTEANLTSANLWGSGINQAGSVYQLNDFELWLAGVRAGTGDQSGTPPTLITQLNVGGESTGNDLNGWIQDFGYAPIRKSDSFMEGITT